MPNINLLPWREEQLQLKNKIFFSIAGAVAIAASILMYCSNLYIDFLSTNQKQNDQLLEKEIKNLDGLIASIKNLQEQKKLLLARRDIIQQLQASRPFIVKVFDGIAKTVPNGMYLTSMVRVDKKLTLEGLSESNEHIAMFMRALQKLDWVKEPANLGEIKSEEINNNNSQNPGVNHPDDAPTNETADLVLFKLSVNLDY
jgi:type IV pilus assembly protein PilN